MTRPPEATTTTRALRALESDNPSVRLRTALAAGTTPDPRFVGRLIERCAVEPDFSVREMLTWALTRHPADITVPGLIGELRSPQSRARSQALHTLSKIGDRRAWPALTPALLTEADDEVARSAWRAAVALVPAGAEAELAGRLSSQLGRGGRETQLSLSRALIAIGEAAGPVLTAAATHPDPRVRAHVLATEQLRRDPEAGFELAIKEAKRVVALGDTGRG
jgi:HEAT repeat protein